MSDPENPNRPLIAGQSAVNVPAAGGSSSRAYKVAGITLLACVLIAGQAMTAYFLLSQGSDIKSLENQNKNLESQMRARPDTVPMQVNRPINSLPGLIMDPMDEETSTKVHDKPAASRSTECQQEAAGLKPVQVPGYHPVCDDRGFYKPQQCFKGSCWCVNPANGQEIPNSIRNGPASCGAAVQSASASMGRLLALPEISD